MATIFVTGATGVLGRATVKRLVAAGHSVRGLARNAERAALVESLGGEPIVADIYDLDAMTDAMSGAHTLLHLATSIPLIEKARKASEWVENDKLRTVGSKVLVDAAIAAGVDRVVAESITFIYADGGDAWIDERSPVDAGGAFHAVAALEDEVARFAAHGGTGIVLRFGLFYGTDARSTDEYLKVARRHVAPVIGAPDEYMSSINTDDAASAVVASLDAPPGVYNVVDDQPLTRRAFVDAFASGFGLKHLRFVPPTIAKVAGGSTVRSLLRSQRVSNAAFTRATGWVPEQSSAIEGWAAVAAARTESINA